MGDRDDMAAGDRFAAVVVSYNRSRLLEETLRGLMDQTLALSRIVVVDNGSSDGAPDVAEAMVGAAHVIRLPRNTGGAGGFATGIAKALEAPEVDWVWVMDDDTVPDVGAAAAFREALARYPRRRDLAVVASAVRWTDGTPHRMNTPRPRFGASRREVEDAASIGAIAVRSVSFVSSAYRADVVRRRGLPIVDYFLWNDDFEFSTRIAKGMRAVVVPESVVVHKTRENASSDADPGERFYFEVRNKIWLFRHSRSLTRVEKLLYIAATARRWVRTFARSSRRRVLLSALRRGVRDAVRKGPRANGMALERLEVPQEVLSSVARAEGASGAEGRHRRG